MHLTWTWLTEACHQHWNQHIPHTKPSCPSMNSAEAWSGFAEWIRALTAVATLHPEEMKNKHSRKGKSRLSPRQSAMHRSKYAPSTKITLSGVKGTQGTNDHHTTKLRTLSSVWGLKLVLVATLSSTQTDTCSNHGILFLRASWLPMMQGSRPQLEHVAVCWESTRGPCRDLTEKKTEWDGKEQREPGRNARKTPKAPKPPWSLQTARSHGRCSPVKPCL